MAISASMVKELRERTGAGMMDCKKVLEETNGDMDKAIDVLREKGLAKAAKKAGRVAAEGLVRMAFGEGGRSAAMVEVNSETDFVAKNADFVSFVETLAALALQAESDDTAAFLDLSYPGEGTVREALNSRIATIGENMSVRRVYKAAAPGVVYVGYVHGNGKIGVVVGLETEAPLEDVQVCGKDVAMQVASMNPRFVDESGVDPDWLKEETKIAEQLLLNEGKKPEMMDRILPGKIKAILKEVCLLDQKFVKNGDLTVKQYVDQAAQEAGKSIRIASMARYEVGEGIEKKEENFAEEVAKQMNA